MRELEWYMKSVLSLGQQRGPKESPSRWNMALYYAYSVCKFPVPRTSSSLSLVY